MRGVAAAGDARRGQGLGGAPSDAVSRGRRRIHTGLCFESGKWAVAGGVAHGTLSAFCRDAMEWALVAPRLPQSLAGICRGGVPDGIFREVAFGWRCDSVRAATAGDSVLGRDR